MTPRIRSLVVVCAAATLASACTSGGSTATAPPTATPGVDATSFAAQVASTDLYVGAPQRVQVGVFAQTTDGLVLLTSGAIEVRLTPFEDGPGTPIEGMASYVAAPFTGGSPDGSPTLTTPSEARGIYQLSDVTFDGSGIWQADIAIDVRGQPIQLQTQFEVLRRPKLPAPGDEAIPTENLTVDSDAPAAAVDSRADVDGEIPDPDLHDETIAGALRRGVPVLALFATPVYCTSQFCGPDADWLAELATERPDDAAYIHIEIWEEFDTRLNQAAIDWLFRDDNLTEPWLYLIDGDGVIVDRWAPLFDPVEVEAALDAVPS